MSVASRSSRALLVSGIVASTSASAHAAELAARGPAECADVQELTFRIERSIGMPLGKAAPLHFAVEMARVAAGHQARIDVRRGASPEVAMQRVLTAADCEKLANAVSVAIALALGGEAAASPSGSAVPLATPPSTSSSSPAAPDAAAFADDAAGSLPRVGPRVVPALSLWVLGDVGSLPSPAWGVAIGAEAGWRRFELRLLGTLLFEQQAYLEGSLASGPGAKLELLTGAALGCTAPWGDLRAPLAPVVCLGMELGQLAGVGTGVINPHRGTALWAAPVVQVGAVWAVPHTALQLSSMLSGAAPLNRDQFALIGIGNIHQPPPLIGRWSLGVRVMFD